MNKTKIEWCDFSWNPVTGCRHGCPYCYARRLAEGRLKGRYGYPKVNPFGPTFHTERLFEPDKVKKPSRIFTVSMGDLLGDWVHKEWILSVLTAVLANPRHTFMFLTKNPKRYAEFTWPRNAWLGTSITGEPGSLTRMETLLLNTTSENIRWVSLEPILEFPSLSASLDWVVIGAMTGPNPQRPAQLQQWTRELIKEMHDSGRPVFVKDNVGYPETVKEWPGVR